MLACVRVVPVGRVRGVCRDVFATSAQGQVRRAEAESSLGQATHQYQGMLTLPCTCLDASIKVSDALHNAGPNDVSKRLACSSCRDRWISSLLLKARPKLRASWCKPWLKTATLTSQPSLITAGERIDVLPVVQSPDVVLWVSTLLPY